MLSDYSGLNIKSKGFSRTKRIPLIILDDETIYLVKATHDVKDIERIYYELNDIISLSEEEFEGLSPKKIIIIINFEKNDDKHLKKFTDTLFLSLEKLYDNFLLKDINNISGHTKNSRC